MYLVALCSDIRAPRSSGFCSSGVAKVLSTSTGTSPHCRRRPRCRRRSSVGLPGVSTITSPVSGRIAPRTSSSSQKVTSAPSRPEPSRWSVPPYSGRTATMCRLPVAPGDRIAAVIAAMPEENATAASACLDPASPSSNRAIVGFQSRDRRCRRRAADARRSPSPRTSRRRAGCPAADWWRQIDRGRVHAQRGEVGASRVHGDGVGMLRSIVRYVIEHAPRIPLRAELRQMSCCELRDLMRSWSNEQSHAIPRSGS